MRALPILLLVAALGACAGEPAADSAATGDTATVAAAAPAPRTDVFANAYAEVATITLAPGEALPTHEGGRRAIYALSDHTVRFAQGADTTERAWTAGEAHFHPAGPHSVEHVGTTKARFLVVARTATALPPAAAHPAEPAKAAPADGPMRLRLDNDDLKVSEVRLPAGATLPKHHGLARIVYSLGDYTISYASNDGAPEPQTFTAGTAHCHDADEHVITNTGTAEARFLLVQFKR